MARMMDMTAKPARRIIAGKFALACVAATALHGCGRNAAADAENRSATILANSAGSGVFPLQELGRDDLADVEFAGDMACAFSTRPVGDPLMLAVGTNRQDAPAAQTIVKYAEVVVEGSAAQPGGIDAILAGGSFDTPGMLVDVAFGDDTAAGPADSVARPAFMRTRQPGDGEQVSEGFWACGPLPSDLAE